MHHHKILNTLSQNTNYTVQNTKYNCSKLSPACHCFTLQFIELCIATCFTKCIVTITNCTITKYQLHHNKIPNTPSQNTKYTSTKYQLHCPKYNIQLIETQNNHDQLHWFHLCCTQLAESIASKKKSSSTLGTSI